MGFYISWHLTGIIKEVLTFLDMVCKYYLSSPFSTHRQAANAAQALCGILDSPFINIWMPHERNITTWREEKGADCPPSEENIRFVSSMLLDGRTSRRIFSPFFLLSGAMLIFHSQTPSILSTGYTWHVTLRIILHHLRKKSQAVNMLMLLQISKRIQPGLSGSASSHDMTFQHHLDL